MTLTRPALARDAVALAALKAAVSLYVLGHGFSHVSDDDYARTVIAEQFAHAPRLDPSGTSWLPLPFWIEGSAMGVFGRSLAVARIVAVALSAAAVAAPYLAQRAVGVRRADAVLATCVAMAIPWSAWLGAATVPESWVGALVGAALIALVDDRARPWCAAALLAASLCRYEAWPAALVLAAACAARARDGATPLRREVAWACVGALGAALWMAWNLHAHGSALHFVARVRTFRRAIGAADVPLADKILGYPRSLVLETPEAAALGAIGMVGIAADPVLRARWRWPIAGSAVVLAFLVAGDVRDGAPTHHPARALSPLWWVLTACGVDALGAALRRSPVLGARPRTAGARVTVALAALAWLVWLPARWKDAPGQTEVERRDAQIARGEDFARRDVAAADLTPCSFEHFALLASWAHPERATVHERLGTPPTSACPLVVER